MSYKKVSLVIPVFNEESSITKLIEGISRQTYQPEEVIFVDGGSSDKTIEIIEETVLKDNKYRLIKTSRSTPGKGRNIGIENARNEWIALTDAGIEIDDEWLNFLVIESENNPHAELIYGNYSPLINSFFEKCATLSYVPPLHKNSIRGKSVVSMLLRKKVWEIVGGFPDLRAAEDLMFMEAVGTKNIKLGFAPKAVVYWQLRPNIYSTFRKFILYSKHNVWAGRAWDWHYGVAKQYSLAFLFSFLAVYFSWWWAVVVLLWLFARTAKRILMHRYEFGLKSLINPFYFFTVMFLILIIDISTFIGWGQAIIFKKP